MRKAAFLDRDGTINIEKNYLYRIEDFEYMDGAVEGLRRLQELGYLLVIVTNQSGIARGYYTEEEYENLTQWMQEDLSQKGVEIDAIYYCPHHPKAEILQYAKVCNCRKPGTGLFYMAAKECDIDFRNSIVIGDKLRDLEICKEQEVKGFWISEEICEIPNVISCNDWNEIMREVEALNKDVDHI